MIRIEYRLDLKSEIIEEYEPGSFRILDGDRIITGIFPNTSSQGFIGGWIFRDVLQLLVSIDKLNNNEKYIINFLENPTRLILIPDGTDVQVITEYDENLNVKNLKYFENQPRIVDKHELINGIIQFSKTFSEDMENKILSEAAQEKKAAIIELIQRHT